MVRGENLHIEDTDPEADPGLHGTAWHEGCGQVAGVDGLPPKE